MRRLLFLFLLFLSFIVGCGTLVTTLPDGTDLEISSFSVDENSFSVTIMNNGRISAGSFEVTFTVNEIYLREPGTKIVTIESLSAGESIRLVVSDVSSLIDNGEDHYAVVRLDSSSRIIETSELNNSEGLYFYTGVYENEYNSVKANLATWQNEISDRLLTDYGFPCDQACYVRLLDALSSEAGTYSGVMTLEWLFESSDPTAVLLLNIELVHSGYTTYEYDGVLYYSDTSHEVMYHEYTHAYHWQYVAANGGIWDATNIPFWFREGFAVYCAGHGPKIVKRMVASLKDDEYTLEETKTRILDGLQDEGHDRYDYAEDFLALQYIVNNYGQTILMNIVQDNSSGTSIESAVLNNLSGIDNWASFEADVYAYARASIEAIYPLVN